MAWWNRSSPDPEDEELEDEYEEDEEEEAEEEEDAGGDDASKSALKDYNEYHMSFREWLFYVILAAVVIFGVGMIFYHNVVIAGVLSLAAFRYPPIRKKQLIRRQKEELTLQFKDLLYSLSAAMGAGRELENAFPRALQDMKILYPDKDTPIMAETAQIVRRIRLNNPVEDAIGDFAARSHIEDIQSFADVIKVCKNVGGDLVEVTRSTSQIISEKIETKNEIETTLTGKKFESRIMCLTPILMVQMLSMFVPDFMEPVFDWHNPLGPIAMTIGIAFFVAAYFIGERIMDIEV